MSQFQPGRRNGGSRSPDVFIKPEPGEESPGLIGQLPRALTAESGDGLRPKKEEEEEEKKKHGHRHHGEASWQGGRGGGRGHVKSEEELHHSGLSNEALYEILQRDSSDSEVNKDYAKHLWSVMSHEEAVKISAEAILYSKLERFWEHRERHYTAWRTWMTDYRPNFPLLLLFTVIVNVRKETKERFDKSPFRELGFKEGDFLRFWWLTLQKKHSFNRELSQDMKLMDQGYMGNEYRFPTYVDYFAFSSCLEEIRVGGDLPEHFCQPRWSSHTTELNERCSNIRALAKQCTETYQYSLRESLEVIWNSLFSKFRTPYWLMDAEKSLHLSRSFGENPESMQNEQRDLRDWLGHCLFESNEFFGRVLFLSIKPDAPFPQSLLVDRALPGEGDEPIFTTVLSKITYPEAAGQDLFDMNEELHIENPYHYTNHAYDRLAKQIKEISRRFLSFPLCQVLQIFWRCKFPTAPVPEALNFQQDDLLRVPVVRGALILLDAERPNFIKLSIRECLNNEAIRERLGTLSRLSPQYYGTQHITPRLYLGCFRTSRDMWFNEIEAAQTRNPGSTLDQVYQNITTPSIIRRLANPSERP